MFETAIEIHTAKKNFSGLHRRREHEMRFGFEVQTTAQAVGVVFEQKAAIEQFIDDAGDTVFADAVAAREFRAAERAIEMQRAQNLVLVCDAFDNLFSRHESHPFYLSYHI